LPAWVIGSIVAGIAGMGVVVVIVVMSWRRKVHESEEKQHALYQELSEMAKSLPVVLDRLPIAAMMVELDGTVSYVNGLFVDIFGRTREEIPSFYAFHHMSAVNESERRLLWEKWETIVTGQQPNPYVRIDHFLLADREGREHTCRVDIHRLGKKFLITFVDYTATRAKENEEAYRQAQLLLTMKEKDMLFMELEHRVRNTLQLMRSFIRLQSGLMPHYTTEELYLKLLCGVDLLTIVQNYTMQDLQLRLYDVKMPFLDFLRHVQEDIGIQVEAEITPMLVNAQSLLSLIFAAQEVMFLIWHCCRGEKKIRIALQGSEEILLHIAVDGSLENRERELEVARDLVESLGGQLEYAFEPQFWVRISLSGEHLRSL